MKVALYSRVSKEEVSSDGTLQDPENQLIPMRKYCEAMGWEISAEFIDRASGGDSNRPDFQRMMGRVRQKHFDIIVIWSLDRFSREGITNTLSYIEQLKSYNTGLVSLQESWLNTTQKGVAELLLAIFSWVAGEEKRKISERTKAALQKLKDKGQKLGRPNSLNSLFIETRRAEIWDKYKKGKRVSTLAKEYGISSYTIKRLINAGKKKGAI
jgi:DNA invertase Pin-like site-specific DNA recombinase